MKGVSILGSTGSIGAQTLDVIRLNPDRFKVAALAAGLNVLRLGLQIEEFAPQLVACGSPEASMEIRRIFPSQYVANDLLEAATHEGAEIVVAGLPGSVGLAPTFAAADSGKTIALATKEVLVMAGKLFMNTVREKGIALLPVDSEQSAIFQCLQGAKSEIRRIILTASGGPFRDMPLSEFDGVTPERALKHPRWKMGHKVTIDSATLLNKGLEVIEAAWLFDVPAEKIEVVVHPQSIVHSMVEFADGSILAQLGDTDMRIPISYALGYPDRIESGAARVDFPALGSLTFLQPDDTKFPLLKTAYDALKSGRSSAPIIYNAADEVAVDLFLKGKISFTQIPKLVLESLEKDPSLEFNSLDEIVDFHNSICDEIYSTGEYSGRH
jgi:1-deoxy-D-xylulose-5-phosphate reductoisomerase